MSVVEGSAPLSPPAPSPVFLYAVVQSLSSLLVKEDLIPPSLYRTFQLTNFFYAQAQRPWLTGPAAPRHVRSSRTGARTRVPCIGRRTLNHCTTREALLYVLYSEPITVLNEKAFETSLEGQGFGLRALNAGGIGSSQWSVS